MTESEPGITLRQQWDRRQGTILIAAIAVMVMLSAAWLGYQGWRLLWQPAELAGRPVHPGAIDLIERYNEIRFWFAGRWVPNPVYPPASYLMLWPLLGWLPLQSTIILWAVVSSGALTWLVAITLRESGVSGRLPRLFVALMPVSIYATGATIGNGQLNLLVLPMVVAGVLTLRRAPAGWQGDLSGSLLILASLVKPSFSAPFFWIVALTLGRLRPALLIVLGYVTLALAASPFNQGGPISQHYNWLAFGSEAAFYSSSVAKVAPGRPTWPTEASINLAQYLLSLVSLQRLAHGVSLAILVALGVWVYRNRRADIWLVLGVSALVSRFWTYHRWYDDILILLPMITLVRIARSEDRPAVSPAGWLLACAVLTSLPPGGLFLLPPPWDGAYVSIQLMLWLVMLGYLLRWGRQRT